MIASNLGLDLYAQVSQRLVGKLIEEGEVEGTYVPSVGVVPTEPPAPTPAPEPAPAPAPEPAPAPAPEETPQG